MRRPCSIIVVFFDGLGLLNACLASLQETIGCDDEVIVVINSPRKSNHSLVLPDDRFRSISFFEALGHAKAANEGAASARHEFLVICDHDLVFSSGWLDHLWCYYSSSDVLAAVSCRVLNPHNDRVLDFGIAYSEFNGAHPYLDRSREHPLVSHDIVAQAVCTGGMLVSRRKFLELGGFDEKMGTLYSDVDLCLRLKRQGLRVGAASRAIAYHFGGIFSNRARSYKASELKADIKGYFSRKNADVLDADLDQFYAKSAAHFVRTFGPFKKYFFCNLMNVADPAWYVELFASLGAKYYDGFTWPSGQRDAVQECLYDLLGHDIATQRTAVAYFVDRFIALDNNALWWQARSNFNDVIVDRNANIISATELTTGMGIQFP